MDIPLCNYHQYGHCKYLTRCRNRHVDEVCEDSHCEMNTCERRHPLVCKYFEAFGRCRFNPCSYMHVAASNSVNRNKDTIEKQVTEIKTEIEALKMISVNLEEKVKNVQMICDVNTQKIIHLEGNTDDITNDLVSLNEALDFHKLQMDDNKNDFISFSTVVDTLVMKVSNIERALFSNQPWSPQQPAHVHVHQSSPALPTPPTSRRKKMPP